MRRKVRLMSVFPRGVFATVVVVIALLLGACSPATKEPELVGQAVGAPGTPTGPVRPASPEPTPLAPSFTPEPRSLTPPGASPSAEPTATPEPTYTSTPKATSTPMPTKTPLPAPEPESEPIEPSPTFGDGTWRVGVDILPGTYRSTETTACYWERLSAFTGDLSAILGNDNPGGPAVVTIKATDVGFTSKSCGTWVLAETDTPAAARTEISDGMWRVGVDILAGTYRSAETGGCYWERLSGFSGDLGEIIANDNARGPAVVTIGASDLGFTSRRCGTWVLAETDKPATPSSEITDGTWRVGIDIVPGTYRSSGTEQCYWERVRAFTGELRDIIANDNPRGPAMVTISSGDAGFTSRRCGTWVPAE